MTPDEAGVTSGIRDWVVAEPVGEYSTVHLQYATPINYYCIYKEISVSKFDTEFRYRNICNIDVN